MANHVHVVITHCPDDGPAVRRVLKGTSQAALSRLAGKLRKWWTTGGSDRYKHGASAVAAAIKYVDEQEHVLVKILNNEIVEVR
jgi:REP element-mobilizing transposase RayT